MRGKVRCLSFASVAELRFGAIVGGWQERRRQQLEDAIARTVVLHGDDLTVQHWAEVKAARQRLGRPIGSEDCWIAATALRHGVALLTHNAKDYPKSQTFVSCRTELMHNLDGHRDGRSARPRLLHALSRARADPTG